MIQKLNIYNICSTLAMALCCLVSCSDDYTEKDLFSDRDQRKAEQKAEQDALDTANAEAIAAAAQLLDYSVHLHSNDEPIAGATITVTNQNSGESVSVTTDANGNASFVDIGTGGFVVTIASENHLDMSYVVDFGSPTKGVHYQEVNGNIVATETAESSKIEALALSGMQTATIKGKVEIETDLTNGTPEIPQDLVIRANLDTVLKSSHSELANGNSILVEDSPTFAQGNVGVATVDNVTGEYAMVVPANDEGAMVSLLFPTLELDQNLAWSEENGVDVGLQFGPQSALFGPTIQSVPTPEVASVQADFPEPPPPGRGFAINNIQRVGRGLIELSNDNVLQGNQGFEQTTNTLIYRIEDGSNYSRTPSVTVSEPEIGDDVAQIEAWLYWIMYNTVTLHGNGVYPANSPIAFYLDFDDDTDPNNGLGDGISVSTGSTLNSSPQGLVPGQSLQIGFQNGQLPFNAVQTDFVVAQVRLRADPAMSQPTYGQIGYNNFLYRFGVIHNGSGYTSPPTITVGPEGNPSTEARLSITNMSFQYQFDLDNSGVTQDYVVKPKVEFSAEPSLGFSNNNVDVRPYQADDNGLPNNFENLVNINDLLKVENGGLAYDDADFFGDGDYDGVLMATYSYSTPTPVVIEPLHHQASATVELSKDGLDPTVALSGINTGSGYTAPFEVDIVGLGSNPGSGGSIELHGFTTDPLTPEVIWDGSHIVADPGSGYTGSINIDEVPFSGTQVLQNVKNGEVHIINVHYGTGKPIIELGPEPTPEDEDNL